jgi:hypothetical protein
MEEAGRVEAHSLPGVEPQGTAVALEGPGGRIPVNLGPQLVQAKILADFPDPRMGHLFALLGQWHGTLMNEHFQTSSKVLSGMGSCIRRGFLDIKRRCSMPNS